jgi:hypothetical protein
VEALGEYPLVLLSRGDVKVAGKLLCEGAPGESAGSRLEYAGNCGAAGGRGGPGAGRGGTGGGTLPGNGTVHGRRGEGPGGGEAGKLISDRAAPGGGGGYGPRRDGERESPAGGTYGNIHLLPLFGGSGGGGGSIGDGAFGPGLVLNPGDSEGNGGDLGGGGGGGGGGAVRITAGGDLEFLGTISADGGKGGSGGANLGGHGGGGSGGSILLQSYGGIKVQAGASLTARGGTGGSGVPGLPGGPGAPGRIRFEDSSGMAGFGGQVEPPAAAGKISAGTLGVRDFDCSECPETR